MVEQGGSEASDGPLPERVRHRVVNIASEALGTLRNADIPNPVRPYARFTPNRRAKYAATTLAAALERDAPFRVRVGERVRQAQPDLVEALENGVVPAAADPVDVAAAAYLIRPAGWPKLVAAAGDEARRAETEHLEEEQARTIETLREQLSQAESRVHEATERSRVDLDAAKREADGLRRRVRSAEAEVKRAEAARRKTQAELEQVRSDATSARSAADAEARRLRSRLAEVEAELEAGRRAAREGRNQQDTRLRLLLDSMIDAASGLRRELALPPVTDRPADSVEAVSPEQLGPKDVARRALAEDDPELLDQLLALPQAHLVVDGYNVTKTGYPTLPLEKQRLRLLQGLAALAAQTGAEVTCAFDGADLQTPVLLAAPRGVRVLFSKAEETADELIRRLARAEPEGRTVVVVSSDREVADGVRRAGARPVAAALLLRRLERN